jgi:tetratricopeptide (TPR) repeat protein
MARTVPPKVAALIERGMQLARGSEFQEAARAFERALQQMPELTDVQAMRAESLQMLGRLEDAERAWRQVLRREAGNLAAHEGLAHLYMASLRLRELEAICDAAISLQPRAPGFRLCRAFGLWRQGRHEAALADYREAAALAAGVDAAFFHEASHAEAIALFRLGRWEEGWAKYRWRLDRGALAQRYPRLAPEPAALRDVATSLRIVVHAEQGIGDELFFLRFAPALRARGHRLALRSNAKLVPLLRTRADLFDEVEPADAAAPDCDVELQSSDLALASGESFARPLHLAPDAERRGGLARTLQAFGPPPYLGVTWLAGLIGEERASWKGAYASKQIAPERLGELLRPLGCTVVSLQRKPAPQDMAALAGAAGRPVLDMSAVNEDLIDALALLSLLDDYIGVSNTNMHLLAGLGGRSARVLTHAPAEWRWGIEGKSSAWFPDFSLYRQGSDWSWSEAWDQLRAELEKDYKSAS